MTNDTPDIDKIASALGDAPRRRTHGYWLPLAWAIRALVERGYGVTESAKEVLRRAEVDATPENINCVRVVYYKVKKKMWPKNLEHLRPGRGVSDVESEVATEVEDFEV
jgi:hypothetical protein